jgi:hypothetical protein
MVNFKIIFPAGYSIETIYNDNIDINIILSNGSVYFAILFTVINIQTLMKNEKLLFFWSTDMVIIKDLKKETIMEVVSKIIEEGYLEISFSKIGSIENVYPTKKFYEEVISDI